VAEEKENHAETDPSKRFREREVELREMIAQWRQESRNPVYTLVLSCSQQQMLYLGVVKAVADLGEARLMACARSHEYAGSEFLKEANRLAGEILPEMAATLWDDLTANVLLVKCPPNLVLDYLELDGRRIVRDYREVAASGVRSLAWQRLAPIADKIILDRQKGTITFDLPPGIPRLKESHKRKKPVRRNEKYEGIDKALREFAAARPKSHEEVFRLLDGRKVALPHRRPFKSAGGWLKGFQQNRHTASAWLSQAWGRLSLPSFPRGPQK
jgi:hypothetical protein